MSEIGIPPPHNSDKHHVTVAGNNQPINQPNQGAVTVEVHTQLIHTLNGSKIKKAIRNHPLIHATLIISLMNVTIGKQICDSYVNQRIISLQISDIGHFV